MVWLEDYNPDTLYKVFTKLARIVRDPDGRHHRTLEAVRG